MTSTRLLPAFLLLLLGGLIPSLGAVYAKVCEEGWQPVHRGCYRVERNKKLDWQGALAECENLGGYLIAFNDMEEKNKMKEILGNEKGPWWIGLKKAINGNAWVWLDGTSLNLTIADWDEPLTNYDNCIEIINTGFRFISLNCHTLRYFICEKREGTRCISGARSGPMFERTTKVLPSTPAAATITALQCVAASPLDQTTFPVTTTTTATTMTTSTTAGFDTDLTSPNTSPPVDTRDSKIMSSPTTSQSFFTLNETTRPSTTSQNTEVKTEAEVDLYQLYSGCFLLDLPGRRDVNRPFLYTVAARTCPSLTASHVRWPETAHDTRQSAPCRGNSEGNIFFYCGGNPTCWRGVPDVDQCASRKFRDILEKISVPRNVSEAPEPEVTVTVTTELARVTDNDDVTEEDIAVTSKVIQSLVSSGAASNVQEQKEVENIVANVVRAGSNLVSANKNRVWAHMGGQDKIRSATSLLVAMETATVAMAEQIDEPTTIVIKDKNIELELRVLNVSASAAGQEKQAITYSAENSDNQFSIPLQTLSHLSKGGLARVVFMTHYTMGDILEGTSDNASDYHLMSTDEEVDAADDDKQKNPPTRLASYILSATVGGHQHSVQLPEPISFTMRHIKRVPEGYHSLCSFWSIADSGLGEWSQKGCLVVRSSTNQTTCQCDHMTNFAVLMALQEVKLSEVHVLSLQVVTIVGCIISCLCLLASWVSFTCLTSLQGERNSIHKNLVVCLFIAEMLFLTGIDKTQNRLVCGLIAGCLHYFFLAAFLWMFLEGLYIVLILVKVFSASKSRMPYYYVAAYSPPALIVAISTGLYHQGYGTEKYCWLTTERNFIWSFAGPVAAILCINTIILIYSLTMVCRYSDYVFRGKDKTTAGGIRSWIQGAMALEVLLGLTWILGFFFISQQSVAVAYAFTVLNSTQGLFIFIFYCLLNKKARKEYYRVMRVKSCRSLTTGSGRGTQTTSLSKIKLTSRNSSNSHKRFLDNPALNFHSHV